MCIIGGLFYYVNDGFVVVVGVIYSHPQHVAKLRGGNYYSGGVGETNYDRMRQEIYHNT